MAGVIDDFAQNCLAHLPLINIGDVDMDDDFNNSSDQFDWKNWSNNLGIGSKLESGFLIWSFEDFSSGWWNNEAGQVSTIKSWNNLSDEKQIWFIN